MNVELISYTPNALELLIWTKNTRLQGQQTIYDIYGWPEKKKLEHLEYMLHTIQSAFEHVHYCFSISGISRATTHQLVRTRTASFQQESMRAVDARGADFSGPRQKAYIESIEKSIREYSNLVDNGMQIQDARGVLPTAIRTSIVMDANLRTLSQMAEHRLCTRTQGEYQDLFKMIKNEVIAIHPWAESLLNPHCVKTGLCAFPNYKKCPVQKNCIKPSQKQLNRIKAAWEETEHQANPVAKNGVTM